MEIPENVYFFIVPVLVFGPLFLWILYNFGVKELIKIPGELRRKKNRDAVTAADFATERTRKRGTGAVWLIRGPNKTPFGYFMQAMTYLWFAALIGFFASSPPYLYQDPEMALVKLSFSHPGQRRVECSNRSPQELAKLEPNMRAKLSCPRERWPVYFELELNNQMLFGESAKPAGLSKDGPSSFYQTFVVPPGQYQLKLRLRDKGKDGFGFETAQTLDISPRQIVAVQFHATKGGFIVR